MEINYKITINTQVPDSEIKEIKQENKKLGEFRKLLEYTMEKEIANIFTQKELVSCKVKVNFKKESETTEK